MKTLEIGDKVRYLNPKDPYKKEVLEGIVHGVRTKEIANGDGTTTVIDRTYLIDTGETIREDVGAHAETGEIEIVRQPETIEVRIKQ